MAKHNHKARVRDLYSSVLVDLQQHTHEEGLSFQLLISSWAIEYLKQQGVEVETYLDELASIMGHDPPERSQNVAET